MFTTHDTSRGVVLEWKPLQRMAKKKGHRDAEKQAALAAKKEAKQEKAARKRLIKLNGEIPDDDSDRSSDDDDDDQVILEELVQRYKQQQIAEASSRWQQSAQVVPLPPERPFPLARAHASLTITDDSKKKDVYLFGGEYFDGANTIVSDQLFKYDLSSGQWKQIITATSPPPRCAHAAAYYNKCLYIFGGESSAAAAASSSGGGYHHYRDIWRYDTVAQQWSELKPAAPLSTGKASVPSPRSGMSLTIWKHFFILFGGFFEAETQEPRWYNDIYVLNLQTEQWMDVPYSKLVVRPEPRSACHAALIPDQQQWLIHGGFSKVVTKASRQVEGDDGLPVAETIVYTDAWLLYLSPILEGKVPTWERGLSALSKSKRTESAMVSPNGRSGVVALAYQGNMLLFGGVMDQELHHHKLDSTFFNDLSLFHVKKRKFIPIHVLEKPVHGDGKNKPAGTKADQAVEIDHDAVAAAMQEDDLLRLEEDEADANLKKTGWDLDKLRSSMFAFVDGDGHVIYEKIDTVLEKRQEEKEAEATKRIIERTEPLPRIKAGLFLNGHTLYVYGGLLEVGDREVTLDDMWCIDVRKNRVWQCIYPGSMHEQVWRGALHDDDDSYCSNHTENADFAAVTGPTSARSKSSLGRSLEDREPEEEKIHDDKQASSLESIHAVSLNPKKEMLELVGRYHMEDDSQAPRPGETLDDFSTRTVDFWKDLPDTRQAAEARFTELEPVMQRLTELKRQRKQEKAKKASKEEK
jgi:Galactose oxidase, central domain